jgi:hypothetical protein
MALPRHDRLHVRWRRIEHRCRTIQLSTGDHAASAVPVRQLIQSGRPANAVSKTTITVSAKEN